MIYFSPSGLGAFTAKGNTSTISCAIQPVHFPLEFLLLIALSLGSFHVKSTTLTLLSSVIAFNDVSTIFF